MDSRRSSTDPNEVPQRPTGLVRSKSGARADHGDALVLLARAFAGIESQEVAMTSVDRLGFHVRLKTQDGTRGARVAFLREVSSPAEARKVLVEMAGQARRR
jgi:putative heme iron utilization protein